MEWLFDAYLEWVLKGLSYFFEKINVNLLKLMGIDYAYFNAHVPIITGLTTYIRYIAMSILVVLTAITLVKNFFAFATGRYQSPLRVVARVGLAVFFVAYYRNIIIIMGRFFREFYNELLESDVLNNGTSLYTNYEQTGSTAFRLLDGVTPVGPGENILYIVLFVMLIIEYIKLLLEIVERYIVINLGIAFAPLAGVGIASEETERVTYSYFKLCFSQFLLMIMNVIFLTGANTIISNFGFKDLGNEMIIAMLFAIAWLKAGQQMDAYMKSLGLDVVQTGRGLGESLIGAARGVALAGNKALPILGRGAGAAMSGLGEGMGLKEALSAGFGAAAAGSRTGKAVAAGMADAANKMAQKAGLGNVVSEKGAANAFRNANMAMSGKNAKNFGMQAIGKEMASKLGFDKMNENGFHFNGKGLMTARDGDKGIAIATSPDALKGKNPVVPFTGPDGQQLYAQNLGKEGIMSHAPGKGVKGNMQSVFGDLAGATTSQIATARTPISGSTLGREAVASISSTYGIPESCIEQGSISFSESGGASLSYTDFNGAEKAADLQGGFTTEGLGNNMVGIGYEIQDLEGNTIGNASVGSVAMMGADTSLSGGTEIEGMIDSNTYFNAGSLSHMTSDDQMKELFSQDTVDNAMAQFYGSNSEVSITGYDAENGVFELDNDEILRVYDASEYCGDKNTIEMKGNDGASYVVARSVLNDKTKEYIDKSKVFKRTVPLKEF